MHRLEGRRKFPLRIDVCGWRDADGPAHGRPQIGKNVAEKIRSDDDVEPFGSLHEVRGEDVDVILVGANARIARGHFAEALVPVGHRDRDAVRLGGRGDVCFSLRVFASSNANFMMRSTPVRVKMVCWNTVSRSVPFEYAAADR
jgi:hypothetical protein